MFNQKTLLKLENIKRNKKKAKTQEEEAGESADLKNKVAEVVA